MLIKIKFKKKKKLKKKRINKHLQPLKLIKTLNI